MRVCVPEPELGLAHLLLLLFSAPCQLSLFILLFDHQLFVCLELGITGS